MARELGRLADAMFLVLCEAQKLRSQKSKWVDGTLEWIIYERQAMLDAVNRERLKRGRPFVAEVDVLRVEQWATGHCDYGRKFALYCAELVLQD